MEALPKKRIAVRKKRAVSPRATKPRRAVKPSRPISPPSSTPTVSTRQAVSRTYLFAVGRRKSAIARLRFVPSERESITVNNQTLDKYFTEIPLRHICLQPLESIAHRLTGTFSIQAVGGGKHGQAEAIRLGMARVLTRANAELRPVLKHVGFLTRDPRVKERKKYGLKRARRAPQWQKR